MNQRLLSVPALLLVSVLTAGCTGSAERIGESAPAPSASSDPTPVSASEVVLTGLSSPWDVVVDEADGAVRYWVTNRDEGMLERHDPATNRVESWEVPGSTHDGEGGLLGVAIDPSGEWIYLYTTRDDENVVVRTARAAPGEFTTILDGIPASSIHNGGRLVFGPDGMLYVSTGDASDTGLAQDRQSLAGKVLRVTPDGGVPEGNPTPGSPVWSLGHRNPQGLAFDEEGRLWASEFGQNTFDEVNLIEAGQNYGWPLVEGVGDDTRFRDPVLTWSPEEASPSGVAVVGGDLLVAALRGARVWSVALEGDGIGDVGVVRDDLGRTRSITPVDGGVLVLTSNTDGRGDPRADDDRLVFTPLP